MMRVVLFLGALAGATAVQQHNFWSWPFFGHRQKKEEAEPVKVQAKVETVSDGRPTQPGCYRRLPSGCWRYQSGSRMSEWSHDVVAEQDPFIDAESCLARKNVWDKYCSTKDSEVFFVAGTIQRKKLTTTPEPMAEEQEEAEKDLAEANKTKGQTAEDMSTTEATTTTLNVDQVVHKIESRGPNSDFFKEVDKEAEREYQDEKAAKVKAEAEKALERERRNTAKRMAATAEATASSKKAAMDSATKTLKDKQKDIDYDEKSIADGTQEIANAEQAVTEAEKKLEDAHTNVAEKIGAIKRSEELLDRAEADGSDPSDMLKQAAADAKEAASKAENEVTEAEQGVKAAKQRVVDSMKHIKDMEGKLKTDTLMRGNLEAKARHMAVEYEGAKEIADQRRTLADRARALEDGESNKEKERRAADEKAIAEAQAKREKKEQDKIQKKLDEEAKQRAEDKAIQQAANEAKRAVEETKKAEQEAQKAEAEALKAELEQAKQVDAASDKVNQPAQEIVQESSNSLPQEPVPQEQAAAESTQKTQDLERLPEEPGCYMKMPSGCQGKTSNVQRWRHDKWAEDRNLDSSACEERKSVWDHYCGREDVQVKFVPKAADQAAQQAAQPAAEKSSPEAEAEADDAAQGNAMPQDAAAQDAAAQEDKMSMLQEQWPWSRKKVAVEKKAEKDADVSEELPAEPGCYMKMPSGCPRNPMNTRLWRHDAWAEHHGLDEAGCHERKQVWDKYCESGDAKIVFVSNATSPAPVSALQVSDSESLSWPTWKSFAPWKKAAKGVALDADEVKPLDPGCYMKMPSGCPKNPMNTKLWRHDAWAERRGVDEEGCQKRKAVWNKYCEADDAKVVFIANTTSPN